MAATRIDDRYRIEGRIGAGGMGEVLRAFDLTMERIVAIKLLAAGALEDDPTRRSLATLKTHVLRIPFPAARLREGENRVELRLTPLPGDRASYALSLRELGFLGRFDGSRADGEDGRRH